VAITADLFMLACDFVMFSHPETSARSLTKKIDFRLWRTLPFCRPSLMSSSHSKKPLK
jgi:hypothetical protein